MTYTRVSNIDISRWCEVNGQREESESSQSNISHAIIDVQNYSVDMDINIVTFWYTVII